jgi:hypothetical protein
LIKESKVLEKIFPDFDPFIFGITFWQTLVTNWWYNIGRDLTKEYIIMTEYWYDNILKFGYTNSI